MTLSWLWDAEIFPFARRKRGIRDQGAGRDTPDFDDLAIERTPEAWPSCFSPYNTGSGGDVDN